MLTSPLHVISHVVSASEISRRKYSGYYSANAEGVRTYVAEEHKRYLGRSGKQ